MSSTTNYINNYCTAKHLTDLISSTTKNYGGCLARWTSIENIEPLISNLPFLKNFTSSKDLQANKSQEIKVTI